jgi:hypothetical protein
MAVAEKFNSEPEGLKPDSLSGSALPDFFFLGLSPGAPT